MLRDLQNKKMLRPTQRLVALAILHQNYSSQKPSSNPFISLLVNVSVLAMQDVLTFSCNSCTKSACFVFVFLLFHILENSIIRYVISFL